MFHWTTGSVSVVFKYDDDDDDDDGKGASK